MNCPYCNGSTKVTNSRSHNNAVVWRRRECKSCKSVWTTHEQIDFSTSHRIIDGSQKHPEPLQRDTILKMITGSLQHRDDAWEAAPSLTDTILTKVLTLKTPEIPRQAMHDIIHETLKAYDPTAAAVFAAKKRT